jgi:hypothetical protein
MRLGQLARKLALRPSQIVDYLTARNIFPDEGSNARLSDEVTERIVLHFAPTRLSEILLSDERSLESTLVSVEKPEQIEPVSTPVAEEVTVESSSPTVEVTDEKPKVIKVPKVELSGLKVLGKIDLPEPKKKIIPDSETTEAPNDAVEKIEEKKPRGNERKDNFQRRESHKQRPARNPIAEQREQKAREEEEKRKAKLERDKEKRTQYYFERVKTGQPTKAMKLVSEPVESYPTQETKPEPKTWWGRFLRWLNT